MADETHSNGVPEASFQEVKWESGGCFMIAPTGIELCGPNEVFLGSIQMPHEHNTNLPA